MKAYIFSLMQTEYSTPKNNFHSRQRFIEPHNPTSPAVLKAPDGKLASLLTPL